MNECPFKPGDVVRLKSGGPPLAVASLTDGGVLCCWFDGTGRAQEMRFRACLLEALGPGERPHEPAVKHTAGPVPRPW